MTLPGNPNEWIVMCKQGVSLNPDERVRLLTEILNTSTGQGIGLMELAGAVDCQSIFRCAAVDRLVQIEPNRKTILFLLKLIDPRSKQDEDLRITAYEAYKFLVPSDNSVSGVVAARTRGSRRKPSDPSPRINWLMSLDD